MAPPPGPWSVLGHLLSIDTWYRASIVLALGGAVGLGALVYQHPDTIGAALRSFAARDTQPRGAYLSPIGSDIARDLRTLLAQFAPQMVAVTAWSVDLDANQAHLVEWAVLPASQDLFDQLYDERLRFPLALFGDHPTVNQMLGRLYIGRFHCTTDMDPWNTAVRLGVVELCMAAIPPTGYGLGGLIVGGWRARIPPERAAHIESAFREVALHLTWWPKPPLR